jgi:hypothetical protein
MRWLLWLYPRAWRRCYGPEMEALLEETKLTPAVLLDLVRGALDAHLHPEWRSSRSGPRRRYRWSWVFPVALVAAAEYGVVVVAFRARLTVPLVAAMGAAAAVLAASAAGLLRRGLRRRRRRSGPGSPGQGAPVPASPLPDTPPALASRGSGRRSGRE